MNVLSILLQAEAQQQGSQWSFWVMMILIFVVMWLFMIRPQQKKQKELEEQRKQMRAGDRVVTAGGIHGKIEKVKDGTFEVSIAKGVSIEIDKASVFAEAQPEAKKPTKSDDKASKREEETKPLNEQK